jgi:hypothetical protein
MIERNVLAYIACLMNGLMVSSILNIVSTRLLVLHKPDEFHSKLACSSENTLVEIWCRVANNRKLARFRAYAQ